MSSQSELTPSLQAVVSGAKQLNKLKRFLTTLLQFSSDISPDISESVKVLVLKLINSAITIEDFHSRLQEITNFPLRPFVIPFLKVNLPLLQNELMFFEQNPDLLFQQHANRFNANIPNHLASVGPNGNESEFSPSKRKSDENSLGQACHHKSPRVKNNQANPFAHLMMMNPQAQQYFSEMFPYEELYNAGQFNDL